MQQDIDLCIKQGATLNKPIVWQTVNSDNTRTPVDLTGYTGQGQIYDTRNNKQIIALTVSITSALNGAFAFSLTAAQTAALNFDGPENRYEVFLTAPDSTVTFIVGGVAKLETSGP